MTVNHNFKKGVIYIMAKKLRKEKYIKTKTYKGNVYFTVQFAYDGKTYSKTFNSAKFPTERDALNAAVDHRDLMRAKLISGEMIKPAKTTVQKCFDTYEEIYVQSDATHRRHLTTYKLIEDYSNRFLSEITLSDVEESLAKLAYSHTDAQLSRVASIWKQIYMAGIRLGAVQYSPMEAVHIPRSKVVKEARSQDCTDEDADAMIEALAVFGQRESCKRKCANAIMIIQIMRYTGMRPAEVLALTKDCLDFDKKVIHVKQSIGTDKDGFKAIMPTKTKLSRRDIPMSEQAEKLLRTACSLSTRDLLLTESDGFPVDISPISVVINLCAAKNHINFHLYSMRHLFATKLVRSNDVDVRTIMELMGHTASEMTYSYARSNDSLKVEAVELVETGRKPS